VEREHNRCRGCPTYVSIPRCRWTLPIGHLIVDAAIPGLLTGPPVVALLDVGNLPAAVLAHALRSIQDPVWLCIHESLALAVWFLLGLGIDVRRFPLRAEMIAFLALRAVVVVAVRVSYPLWRPAAAVEGLVWLALAIWGAGWCLIRAAKKLRAI
jgi:hypothetical protein